MVEILSQIQFCFPNISAPLKSLRNLHMDVSFQEKDRFKGTLSPLYLIYEEITFLNNKEKAKDCFGPPSPLK